MDGPRRVQASPAKNIPASGGSTLISSHRTTLNFRLFFSTFTFSISSSDPLFSSIIFEKFYSFPQGQPMHAQASRRDSPRSSSLAQLSQLPFLRQLTDNSPFASTQGEFLPGSVCVMFNGAQASLETLNILFFHFFFFFLFFNSRSYAITCRSDLFETWWTKANFNMLFFLSISCHNRHPCANVTDI